MSKKGLLSSVRALVIVIALTFSTNSHASGWWGSWSWPKWWGGGSYTHTHYYGCGHTSTGGGGSQSGGDSIPLDGGLSILLAGAAFFGIKKLRGNHKNEI